MDLSDETKKEKRKSFTAKLGGLIKRTPSSSSNASSSHSSLGRRMSERQSEVSGSPSLIQASYQSRSTFISHSPSMLTSPSTRSGSSLHSQMSMSSPPSFFERSTRTSPNRKSPSGGTDNLSVEQGAAASSTPSSIGFSPQTLSQMRVDTALRFALMATNMPLIHTVMSRKALNPGSPIGARFRKLSFKVKTEILSQSILEDSSRMRLYVLVRGGVMRYDREMDDDSITPEDIHIFSSKTICCVTDIISGLKWVLELSTPNTKPDPDQTDGRSLSPSNLIKRSSSSRLSPSRKRDDESSKRWYLVAPNADSLSKWLSAIKSQIAELNANEAPSPPRFITAGEAFAVHDEIARIRAERSTSPTTIASSRRQLSDSRSPHNLRPVVGSNKAIDKPRHSIDAHSTCDADSIQSADTEERKLASNVAPGPHNYQWTPLSPQNSAEFIPRRPPHHPNVNEFDSYDLQNDTLFHPDDINGFSPSRRSSDISSAVNESRRPSTVTMIGERPRPGPMRVDIRLILPASPTSPTSPTIYHGPSSAPPPLPAPNMPLPPIPAAISSS